MRRVPYATNEHRPVARQAERAQRLRLLLLLLPPMLWVPLLLSCAIAPLAPLAFLRITRPFCPYSAHSALLRFVIVRRRGSAAHSPPTHVRRRIAAHIPNTPQLPPLLTIRISVQPYRPTARTQQGWTSALITPSGVATADGVAQAHAGHVAVPPVVGPHTPAATTTTATASLSLRVGWWP